jgi:hypothetical protein
LRGKADMDQPHHYPDFALLNPGYARSQTEINKVALLHPPPRQRGRMREA